MTRKSYREHQAIDDYAKLFSGLILLSIGLGRRLGPIGRTVVTVVGASKVAEGISGYSPVNDFLRMISQDSANVVRQLPWIGEWIQPSTDGQNNEELEQSGSSSPSYDHRQYMSDDHGYPL